HLEPWLTDSRSLKKNPSTNTELAHKMLTTRSHRWAASIFVFLFLAICFDICCGQNMIAESSTFLAANPAKLTETDFSEFIVFCSESSFQVVTNKGGQSQGA